MNTSGSRDEYLRIFHHVSRGDPARSRHGRIFSALFCRQVNETDLRGKTREEAVLLLLSLQERVDMLVQYRPHGERFRSCAVVFSVVT